MAVVSHLGGFAAALAGHQKICSECEKQTCWLQSAVPRNANVKTFTVNKSS